MIVALGWLAIACATSAVRAETHTVTMTDPQIVTVGYHIGVGGHLIDTDENFVEDGVWVEAWWAQLDNPNTSQDAEFVPGHFHLGTSPSWHIINHGHTVSFAGEYQGFMVEMVDGRPLSLSSLKYRLLDTDAPQRSYSTEIFVCENIDPLQPVPDQCVPFTVSSAPGFQTLTVTGFEHLPRVFVTCTLGEVNERMLWDDVVIEVDECASDADCDDADACSTDYCTGGVCVHDPLVCDDGNPCTDDTCDPALACIHSNNTAPCDDGIFCNGTESCSAGSCVTGSDPCPGLLCDESSGICVECFSGADCEDGSYCNGAEECNTGSCVAGVAPCPLLCDEAADTCVECLSDADCDDGNACITGQACVAGACVPGTVVSCDDGNPCTLDSCNPATGCSYVPAQGPCDDGQACTENDVCVGIICRGSPTSGCPCTDAAECNDGNPCTTDTCTAGLCVYADNSDPCDDGDACTVSDVCSAGTCTPGSTVDCDDGNECTGDTCDPSGGCRHDPVAGACDDGDACTEDDACLAGQCQGVAIDCDDQNACTDDSCIDGACVYQSSSASCDDGDACTTGDVCVAGSCVGGPAADCDDDNPCTADSCDATTGCLHDPVGGPCDDGDACTVDDACVGGACVPGTTLNCDDGNPCTDDACDPVAGCVQVDNSAPCDDGDACTAGDVCAVGACVPGGLLDCDDGLYCTGQESCDPAVGCVAGTPPCGANPCDESADICEPASGPTCGEVRNVRLECTSNGALAVMVVLSNVSHDGELVTVSIDGTEVDMTISGRTAYTTWCCPTGVIEVALVSPPGCMTPQSIACGSDPVGACCQQDESCQVTTAADCTGDYQGDGTTCAPGTCTVPSGACCMADESCTVDMVDQCVAAGGSYLGDGTTCDGAPCAIPVGACCDGNACSVQTQVDCQTAGSAYIGDGSDCTGDPCAGAGQITCADVRRLRTRCLTGGSVDLLVVLEDESHDGAVVGVSVDGTLHLLPIAGRFASGTACCHTGDFDVTLVDPAGCVEPVSLSCP